MVTRTHEVCQDYRKTSKIGQRSQEMTRKGMITRTGKVCQGRRKLQGRLRFPKNNM